MRFRKERRNNCQFHNCFEAYLFVINKSTMMTWYNSMNNEKDKRKKIRKCVEKHMKNSPFLRNKRRIENDQKNDDRKIIFYYFVIIFI